MGRLRRRPSPALVVACLALAVALGGTGYAAIVLPANSVGTKQLKNGAVVATKVKMHSLVAENFKDGQLPSGPPGPKGADGLAGVAPNANLVSLDVMNDEGDATVADVIAACDWILANKDAYSIRVANFSLHAASRASVFFDPLDQAVERTEGATLAYVHRKALAKPEVRAIEKRLDSLGLRIVREADLPSDRGDETS